MSLTLRSAQFSLGAAGLLGLAGATVAQDAPPKPTYQEAIRCASYLTQLSASKKSAADRLTDPSAVSEMEANAEDDRQQAMTWLSYSSLFGGTRDQIVADYRADRASFSQELDAARAQGDASIRAYLYPIGAKCEAFEAAFGPDLSQLTG